MSDMQNDFGKYASQPDRRASAKISRETVSAILVFSITALLFLSSRSISPHLGTLSHVQTVLMLASFLVVLSFGQGLVILSGGLDLSLPAVITLGGVLATSINGSGSIPDSFIIPLVVLCCGIVGLFSALGVVWLKVPPFIMTMATSIIVASVALGATKGTPRGVSPDILLTLMKTHVFGVPTPIAFTLAFVVAGWTLQSRTAFGKHLYAVGTNATASRIAGLPVTTTQIVPYIVSAACAGFVGMMLVGYSNGATLRMGEAYMLPSIAAVVIGGSSILGGSGSFIGSVGGALLLTTLGTIISALGIDLGVRTIIEGSIILLALLLLRDEVFQKVRTSWKSSPKN